MGNWANKLDNLWVDTQQAIIDKVKQIGVESEHNNFLVIKVNDENAFNLDGDRYLAELGRISIYDNLGHQYNYGTLNHEQLAQLADWVEYL